MERIFTMNIIDVVHGWYVGAVSMKSRDERMIVDVAPMKSRDGMSVGVVPMKSRDEMSECSSRVFM